MATREQVLQARAALTLLHPERNAALHELITYLGPVDAFDWLTSNGTAQYLSGMSIDQLHTAAGTLNAATRRADARILIPEDPGWPDRLDDLSAVGFPAASSAALCLWIRGTTEPILSRAVAVTGNVAATRPGLEIAWQLGQGLAEAGWTVATGSGYGIAAAALRGALTAGHRAVAVLPVGIDRPHPAGNGALLERVARNGLVLSTYPPGTRPARYRFGAAARLLAGLTSGTVLVESIGRSRALDTVDEAIRRGRPALIVPGPAGSAKSAGSRQLLGATGWARPVHGVGDVLAALPPAPTNNDD